MFLPLSLHIEVPGLMSLVFEARCMHEGTEYIREYNASMGVTLLNLHWERERLWMPQSRTESQLHCLITENEY
jgi:hypothetical protein